MNDPRDDPTWIAALHEALGITDNHFTSIVRDMGADKPEFTGRFFCDYYLVPEVPQKIEPESEQEILVNNVPVLARKWKVVDK